MNVFEVFPSIRDMPIDTPLSIDDHLDHIIESFDLKVTTRSLKGAVQDVINGLDTDQDMKYFEFSFPFTDYKILYCVMVYFVDNDVKTSERVSISKELNEQLSDMLERMDKTANDLRCDVLITGNTIIVHSVAIWNRFNREWLQQLEQTGYEYHFYDRDNMYANVEGETIDDNIMACMVLQNRDALFELIKEEDEDEVIDLASEDGEEIEA